MKFRIHNFLCCILLLFFCLTGNAQTVGLFFSNQGSAPGYILFAPINTDTTYLIDKCGRRIHEWASQYNPGESVHLLDDGSLLHTCDAGNPAFNTGGRGGVIQKMDWGGSVTWSFNYSDYSQCQHHDAIELPSGNILFIAWELHNKEDAVSKGRNPNNIGSKMWVDKLIEVKPIGADSGEIVWQWNIWDHLIQDYDAAKPGYGVIADHPELLNINAGNLNSNLFDWMHCNGIDYNADLDQIILSCNYLSELWIIDHSTTMSEAASHSGGLSGKGGDFLYRWGNPEIYGHGTGIDRKFYGQHNPNWIRNGLPGVGKILVYQNGQSAPAGNFSTVMQLTLPELENHNYVKDPGGSYGPIAPDWLYVADPPTSFYSPAVGSVQRLTNGNTVICEGLSGRFFEVDSIGNVLWQYINPAGMNGITIQGNTPFMNMSFRCVYLPEDHPGMNGQSMVPGSPIEINPLNYSCINEVGVNEFEAAETDFSVYPNPFVENLAIYSHRNIPDAELLVHDITGRILIATEQVSFHGNQAVELHIPDYEGIIFISVTSRDGLVFRARAISQRE